MLEVLFDEVSINSEFGITLAERPVLPVSGARYITYEVPGRNGKLSIFDGYEDVPYSLRFNYIDENAKPAFREIVNFLTGKKKVRLSDNDNYRLISQSVISIKDANNDIEEWCDFEIEIITEPFEYEDAAMQTTTTNTTIVNPSNIEAGVILKVFGTGTCRVLLNENQMIFTDVQDYITVDGIMKKAHKDMSSRDNTMQGRYPVLKSGSNTISVSGQTSKIEIYKRWCWR